MNWFNTIKLVQPRMRPFTANAYVMSTISTKQYACVLNTQCVPEGRHCDKIVLLVNTKY